MRVKITVEVVGDGAQVSMLEVDRIVRGCINGMMEKYRGRIDSILDSYTGSDPSFYGQTTKAKMITIADEEKKVEA